MQARGGDWGFGGGVIKIEEGAEEIRKTDEYRGLGRSGKAMIKK